MKNLRTLITLLIICILASIAAGYVAGFFVYREYKEKTAYFDEQAQSTMDKFQDMERELRGLYSTIENTMDENKMEKKNLLATLEKIKEYLKAVAFLPYLQMST